MPFLSHVPGLLEAFYGERSSTLIATRSATGVINVVPCISLLPDEELPDRRGTGCLTPLSIATPAMSG